MKKQTFLTAVGITALAELGIAGYFYQRTMLRNRAKVERTINMAGTDWSQYADFLAERKAKFQARPKEDVWVKSSDGLNLHGVFFPNGGSRRVVICFHGYTSECMKDYIALSDYYFRQGFALLTVDARAHGQSEGKFVGFGCLDRLDVLCWLKWIRSILGNGVEILLHGTSMGAATVLMASGLELPGQVKGIIADCGFTSPKEVFTHVLHSMYHMPAFPIIQIADAMNQRFAGYGMDECNASREVRKSKTPTLFIHGTADTFVPFRMCDELYRNCSAEKYKFIVKGASHAESYYKDTSGYEDALDAFLNNVF